MEKKQRLRLLRQLMWDYDVSPEVVDEVLRGTGKSAGHFNQEMIIRRLLETYPWFTVIAIISPGKLYAFLTEDQIKRLRSKSLQKHYAFVRQRLQQNLYPD